MQDLIQRFAYWLARFQSEKVFSGPSLYFHERLYATLTAWGLHRMGPRGTKLVSFKEFVEGFRHHREAICELASLRIDRLRDDELAPVAGEIWGLIAKLNIGSPRTTIVSGAKALHHLLPDLIPPIDRAHTLGVLFGSKVVINEEKEGLAFHLLFPQFREIAVACKGAIDKGLAQPTEWDTSITKVIDNGIVVYARAHVLSPLPLVAVTDILAPASQAFLMYRETRFVSVS